MTLTAILLFVVATVYSLAVPPIDLGWGPLYFVIPGWGPFAITAAYLLSYGPERIHRTVLVVAALLFCWYAS